MCFYFAGAVSPEKEKIEQKSAEILDEASPLITK